MTLLSAWALAGLLLSVPLVLIHLRRSRPPSQDVSSLLPWREFASEVPSSARRLGRPLLPILLALQLIILVLLVLSLARPASGLGAPESGQIYVVDGSLWMQHREAGVSRMAIARKTLRRELSALKAGANVQIVLAGPTPALVYHGPAQSAASRIGQLRAGDGEADLYTALRFASALRRVDSEPIHLLRAPEDAQPSVKAPAGAFLSRVIGRRFAYQELTGEAVRCGLPAEPSCAAFVRVVNSSARAQVDELAVVGTKLSQTVNVAGHSSEVVAFSAPPGSWLRLRLKGADAFTPAREAFIAVPSERRLTVTLVGDPVHAEPLARALEASGSAVTLVKPSEYEAKDGTESDVLVLDGFMPPGGLPRTASVLLVATPTVPGGTVSKQLNNNRLSGSDPTSRVLAGLDLESLTIDRTGARSVLLPSWMQALAWSPEGPLLAVGSLQGERVALLTFEPFSSNLPQLPALPELIANLLAWSQEFVPPQAQVGEALLIRETPSVSSTTVSTLGAKKGEQVHAGPLELSRPGLYTIAQQGSWGERSQTVAVNTSPGAPGQRQGSVELNGPSAGPSGSNTPWWPWVLLGALIVLMVEWIYASRQRVRAALA